MAEIQSALPAKFMHVANANKASQKEATADAAQHAAFFGVLKSQLAKLDVPNVELALELTADAEEKLLPAQADAALAADPAASGQVAQVASDANLSIDPIREAAVLSSVVAAQAVPVKDGAMPAQDAESDADLAKSVREVGVRPTAASRSETSLKSSGAAIAADKGQALPPMLLSAQADTALDPALDPAASAASDKIEATLSPALPALLGLRSEAGPASPIALAHSFEQALRQAEAKVNVAIDAPVRSPVFAAEVADKVVWLAGRQGQLADFSLNPPQMGALEVRLTVSGGEATAQFFSPNPAVRDALDAAMPKLRELMAEAGLNLGEAEVRDQAFGRNSDGAQMHAQTRLQDADAGANQAAFTGIGMVRSSGLGLVDLYI